MSKDFDTSADAALERVSKALNSYGSESPYCESTINPDYDVARIRGQMNINKELLWALEVLLDDYEDAAEEWVDDARDNAMVRISYAKAALAKARGEET